MAKTSVLVVDDEADYVEVLVERLSTRGYEVRGAVSGEEALRSLEERQIDVVVLDVIMPGTGGIDTLQEIRKRHPEVGVLMLSGHADVDTAIRGMALGAFDYLVKPVGLDELIYKIEGARDA